MSDDMSACIEALGKSPAVYGLCATAAEHVAELARSTAPVLTGDYQTSIHVEEAQRSGRRVALVVADDWKSMIIEAKTLR